MNISWKLFSLWAIIEHAIATSGGMRTSASDNVYLLQSPETQGFDGYFEIQYKYDTSLCVTVKDFENPLKLLPCKGDDHQTWYWWDDDTIANAVYDDWCITEKRSDSKALVMKYCPGADSVDTRAAQKIEYKGNQLRLIDRKDHNNCIASRGKGKELKLDECDSGDKHQKWKLSSIGDIEVIVEVN